MPLILFAFAVLLAVLFLAVFAYRRLTEAWLQRNGTRVSGQAVTIAPPMSAGLLRRLTSTVTIISFTAADGTARSLIPRSGSTKIALSQAHGAVTVLYDASRPTSDDRIRVGFGPAPATWHRVRLRDAA